MFPIARDMWTLILFELGPFVTMKRITQKKWKGKYDLVAVQG